MGANYVFQHILEHGTAAQRRQIISTIRDHMHEFLCAGDHKENKAPSVVEKAIQLCSAEEKKCLAQAANHLSTSRSRRARKVLQGLENMQNGKAALGGA